MRNLNHSIATNNRLRIIAIDPALHKTGWGVVDVENNCNYYIACGTIKTSPKDATPARLKSIHNQLTEVINEYNPAESAIEETYVNNNPQSSLKLGQARGVLLLTLSLSGLSIAEYAPTLIKKSIVGNGRADKSQIKKMVQILLPNAQINSEDEADALAIALTHSHHRLIITR